MLAAAGGREVALELRLRHGRGRELEALGSRECRGAPDKERHGEHN
jgi:hypothetical protein